MRAPLAVSCLLSLSASLCAAGAAHAAPAAQCLYSGPLGNMAGRHSGDPPVRLELDADGRSVRLVHKVQTNFDSNDPFKAPVMAERATCRLKLDCVVAREGLKGVSFYVMNPDAPSDENVWVHAGSTVTARYADEARNLSCRVTGVESL